MAVHIETAHDGRFFDRFDTNFDFQDVRDPELGAFLRDFHQEVIPDLGQNPTLKEVVQESSGYASLPERFDRPITVFIRKNNVVPVDQETREVRIQGSAIYAVAAIAYTIAESKPDIDIGWSKQAGRRGIVGETVYRLGESPLKNTISDPYGEPMVDGAAGLGKTTGGVIVEFGRPAASAGSPQGERHDEVNEATKQREAYLQRVTQVIVGDKATVHTGDLTLKESREILGLSDTQIKNLITVLNKKGILIYDTEQQEGRRGKPRSIYTREKIQAFSLIARKVGRYSDYLKIPWEEVISQVRNDIGLDNTLNSVIGVPGSPVPEREKIVVGDEKERAINARLTAGLHGAEEHPAAVFDDNTLVRLLNDRRRLPNSVDALDSRFSAQTGVSMEFAESVVRTAFGYSSELSGTVNAMQYKSAIEKILQDARESGRLDAIRRHQILEAVPTFNDAQRQVLQEVTPTLLEQAEAKLPDSDDRITTEVGLRNAVRQVGLSPEAAQAVVFVFLYGKGINNLQRFDPSLKNVTFTVLKQAIQTSRTYMRSNEQLTNLDRLTRVVTRAVREKVVK